MIGFGDGEGKKRRVAGREERKEEERKGREEKRGREDRERRGKKIEARGEAPAPGLFKNREQRRLFMDGDWKRNGGSNSGLMNWRESI